MIDEKPSYKMRQLWEYLSELTYSEMRDVANLFSTAMGDLVGYDKKIEAIENADWMEALDAASRRWKIELSEYEAKFAQSAKADAS